MQNLLMYNNVSIDQQQIGNFCSYEMDPSFGGYNTYFGFPNQQQLVSSCPSNSNANMVPLGSVRRFPSNQPRQHNNLPGNSNANFVPLGSVRRFPSNLQQQQDAAFVGNEDTFGLQQIGRKRRGRRAGRRARLNNIYINEQNIFDESAGVSYDGLNQLENGWFEQHQFAHQNEQYTNDVPFGFEPSQIYEDYGAYYGSYETGTSANWHKEPTGHEKEQWWEKLEQRPQQYFCEMCIVNCSGKASYQSHLEGKTHRKRLEAQHQNGADPGKEKYAYHCEVCSVFSNSRENFEAHLNGQKHQKALKLVLETNGSMPVIEYSGTSSDKPATSKSALSVDAPSTSLSESSRQLCDQFVREKVAQIELGPDELSDAEQLMQRVEQTLFAVSDLLREDSGGADETERPKRLLHGIMRVGLLVKQQLLKSDRRIDLVLLCSVVPTYDLLGQAVALFRQIINANNQPYVFVVEKLSNSAIFISQIGISADIYVTLTCSAMRQWSPGDNDFYPYDEPPNALPSGPCLRALAEMRRTKFYQVKCAPLTPMLSIVKIVRDIKRRVPAWQVLTDWMIELVVHKVLSANSGSNEFCLGDALLALFNAISDGVVLKKGVSLADPCEKLPVDALATVTDKDRMNIYNSARYAIRQIKANKMAKLLAMDGSLGIPSEHPPKRRKTTAPNYQNNSTGTSQDQAMPQIVDAIVLPQQHEPMGSGEEVPIL